MIYVSRDLSDNVNIDYDKKPIFDGLTWSRDKDSEQLWLKNNEFPQIGKGELHQLDTDTMTLTLLEKH